MISITTVVEEGALCLKKHSRASQDVQPKQTAATCSAMLSGSTEMRLIASTSVGPFTALMPNLNDMSLNDRTLHCSDAGVTPNREKSCMGELRLLRGSMWSGI